MLKNTPLLVILFFSFFLTGYYFELTDEKLVMCVLALAVGQVVWILDFFIDTFGELYMENVYASLLYLLSTLGGVMDLLMSSMLESVLLIVLLDFMFYELCSVCWGYQLSAALVSGVSCYDSYGYRMSGYMSGGSLDLVLVLDSVFGQSSSFKDVVRFDELDEIV